MIVRELKTPDDIKNLLAQTYTIPRFTRIYHEGIFVDNTGDHTYRCVSMATDLDLPELEKLKLVRMLWIHDLPEIITSDYSIIQKNSDLTLADDIKTKEELTAKQLLNPDDQMLFEEFNNGLTPIALVAKTIDRIEGNMFFHQALTKWIVSEKYNSLNVPRDEALKYSFQYYKKSISALPTLQYLNQTYENTIRGLLNTQMESIKNSWADVPEDRIPEAIKEQLANSKV